MRIPKVRSALLILAVAALACEQEVPTGVTDATEVASGTIYTIQIALIPATRADHDFHFKDKDGQEFWLDVTSRGDVIVLEGVFNAEDDGDGFFAKATYTKSSSSLTLQSWEADSATDQPVMITHTVTVNTAGDNITGHYVYHKENSGDIDTNLSIIKGTLASMING